MICICYRPFFAGETGRHDRCLSLRWKAIAEGRTSLADLDTEEKRKVGAYYMLTLLSLGYICKLVLFRYDVMISWIELLRRT